MSAPVVGKAAEDNVGELSKPTTDDVSETEDTTSTQKKKAARQVEFYFADANLPYDKFMWGLHTANADHWVPLKSIASFKRMREYEPKGLDWLAQALREHSADRLEVDETKTNVRRTTEVKEPVGQFERSVYAKGFGEEKPDTQEQLESFFSQYGAISSVRLRRTDNKTFKGSVFVEFAELETVSKLINADPKPTYEGKELIIMTKYIHPSQPRSNLTEFLREAYCDMKIKEKGLQGKAADQKRNNIRKGGFDAFREMREAEGKGKEGPELILDFMGQRVKVHEDESGTGYVKEEDLPAPKSGSMLKFEGVDDTKTVRFSHIKDPLKEKFPKPPFISYVRGASFGICAFDDPVDADSLEFIKEKIPKLEDKDIAWTILADEDMKAIQLERANTAAKSIVTMVKSQKTGERGQSRGGGRGGGRGGRGGRGGKGGRGGHKNGGKGAKAAANESQTGEKRKRAVEPDGGPDVGVRGTTGPPAVKKAKVDAES